MTPHASFDDFTILAQGTNKYLLEIKESWLIKRGKPINIKQKHQFRSIILIWQGLIWLDGFTENVIAVGAPALETLQKS